MITVLAAVLGLLLGHVLDVFFDRLYTDGSLAGPACRCPHCHHALRPLQLIPIVGVAWSRGRCPDCDRRLPLRAFLLTPGSAALFVTAELVVAGFGPALLAGFFATVFLALIFTDLERRLIPNRVVYPSLLLAAAFSWAWPDRSVLEIFSGGATALILTSVMFIVGRGALGLGDVKMSILMGLVVGLPSVIVGILIGTLAAGAFILPLMILRVLNRRDYIAYGPFIAIGAVVALFWGEPIWDWYFDR
ncbi:MAG: prepilin peptidase [Chloroflexi bacterium]|nr:prepilin peptidase [Chloroflexota bacterium]